MILILFLYHHTHGGGASSDEIVGRTVYNTGSVHILCSRIRARTCVHSRPALQNVHTAMERAALCCVLVVSYYYYKHTRETGREVAPVSLLSSSEREGPRAADAWRSPRELAARQRLTMDISAW